MPRSCHSAGLDGAGMSEGSTGVPFSSPYCPDNTLPLLEPVSEDQEIHGRRNNGQSHLILLYYGISSFVVLVDSIKLNFYADSRRMAYSIYIHINYYRFI